MRLRMAGLAEAALAFALLIGFGIVAVGCICIAVALSVRSKIAAFGAVCATAVCAALYQPWVVFYPVGPGHHDSDAAFWLSWYRFHAVVWIGVATMSVVSVYVAWSKPKLGEARNKGPHQNGDTPPSGEP